MSKKALKIALILIVIIIAIPAYYTFALMISSDPFCTSKVSNFPTSEVKSEISTTFSQIMNVENTFVAKTEEESARCRTEQETIQFAGYSFEALFGTENYEVDDDKAVDQILLTLGWQRDFEYRIKYYKKKVGNIRYTLNYDWNYKVPIEHNTSPTTGYYSYESFDQLKMNEPEAIRKINPRLENTSNIFSIHITSNYASFSPLLLFE